jgi:hypothetical protein
MEDESVAEGSPFLLGQQIHEREFNFHGVHVASQAQATRHSSDVRIDRDARGIESVSEDDVGCFAADARQSDELRQGGWDFPSKSLDNRFTAGTDVVGLAPEESRRLDELLKFHVVATGEIVGCLESLEQRRRDHVHTRIGALG